MKDLAITLEDRPGALAEMGEALGRAGVSIEGGGVWNGAAHFLFVERSFQRAPVILERFARGGHAEDRNSALRVLCALCVEKNFK